MLGDDDWLPSRFRVVSWATRLCGNRGEVCMRWKQVPHQDSGSRSDVRSYRQSTAPTLPVLVAVNNDRRRWGERAINSITQSDVVARSQSNNRLVRQSTCPFSDHDWLDGLGEKPQLPRQRGRSTRFASPSCGKHIREVGRNHGSDKGR
jgi:hypothetical protein